MLINLTKGKNDIVQYGKTSNVYVKHVYNDILSVDLYRNPFHLSVKFKRIYNGLMGRFSDVIKCDVGIIYSHR